MKKYISLVIFIIITLISSMVFATSSATTVFEVVEDNVCTITLNEYSEFEKRMISYDIENRQVTIQMQITNGSVEEQPTGEIMLVIDNSDSMTAQTSTGSIRRDLVFNSTKTLVSKLLADNENLKVGAVSFSTFSNESEGTTADASLVSELTSDVSALTTAIDNIQTDGLRTDLEAGLEVASSYFSDDDNNKYIIILTDGVPNVALNCTDEYYSDEVIEQTKSKLLSLSDEGYNIITMLTGISDPDVKPTDTSFGTYQEIINEIFGTAENPTAGKFYYIQDSEIEETIVNNIYNDLLPVSQSLTDITITDYFPQEIVDNFDFEYVASPNIGEISAEIDTTNNCIIWTIGELASGETATVQYTLTLIDDYDSDIVGVILDTNERVDITYKDFDGNDQSQTSDETPKVRITELQRRRFNNCYNSSTCCRYTSINFNRSISSNNINNIWC